MAEASSLPGLVEEAAARDPTAEAVRGSGGVLSYGALAALSEKVARGLLGAGIRPGDRVALFAPKSPELIACLYGAMRAGCAYVPIDPRQPIVRAAAVAADCSVAALVATSEGARRLLEAIGQGERPRFVILLDEGPADGLPVPAASVNDLGKREVPGQVLPEVGAHDLAYVLYTSGSTGTPKGVMLTHGNALAFVRWAAAAVEARGDDRFSGHAPLHFDLSVFDLYVAALAGAAITLVPEDESYLGPSLVDFVREHRITVWYSVPSALMVMGRAVVDPDALASLRVVVFAGEVYPTKGLRELRAVLPRVRLWNLYGPTETNVCTAYEIVTLPDDDRTIPIGGACSGDEVFAVTERGDVAEVGEVGELHVRGPSVMRGYWGLPERTAESLVPDPRSGVEPGLVYRTGDVVRVRSDGDYEFLGRRDQQVKSRGYRIELGEVETAIASHPAVEEAVVVPVADERWGTTLAAYVRLANGDVSAVQLKRHVAQRLPRYMVPSEVHVVTGFPRTSTGKVDRRALAGGSSARRSVDRSRAG